MPYRVIHKGDIVESADQVKVNDAGILSTYEDRTVGYVENVKLISLYAKGQWDIVYWDDPEQ